MKKTGTPITIMTQNLRCGYIRDERDGRENMIRSRQHRFKKLVEKYDPDMIALQECTTGWLGLLEDGILDDYTIVYKWITRGVDLIPGETDLGANPVAYKTAKYEELDRGHFWLSQTPEVWSPSYSPDKGPRMVTWVHLKDKETGAKFYFHSTHFTLGEEWEVVESGRQIARRFEAFPEGTNAFVMGDLNSPYRKYCYNGYAYHPGFKDLRDAAQSMAEDGLCEMGEIRVGTYNAFKYPDGCNYIDHILVKPNPRMAIDFYGVLYDHIGVPEKNIPEGYVSDHYAILTKVRIDTEEDYGKYYEYGPEAEEALPDENYPTRREWTEMQKAKGKL